MKLLRLLFKRFLQGLALVLPILISWQLIIVIWSPPEWLFPGPVTVWQRYQELMSAHALQHHVWVTSLEILAGYFLGLFLALATGYPISQIRLLERVATPYLIAANSVPLIAFAPLLILWLGNGILTKILVAALILYFPVTVAAITAFHSQSTMHTRLMRSFRASKWQRFIYLELPNAIPGILAGMKIGAPLAVVGAVIGEFLGTGQGLGHLILEANGLLDTAQLFVAIIILVLIGISFYFSTLALERILVGPWHHKRRNR